LTNFGEINERGFLGSDTGALRRFHYKALLFAGDHLRVLLPHDVEDPVQKLKNTRAGYARPRFNWNLRRRTTTEKMMPGVANPKVWRGECLDFKRATVFRARHRLSKHKTVRYARNACHGPLAMPITCGEGIQLKR